MIRWILVRNTTGVYIINFAPPPARGGAKYDVFVGWGGKVWWYIKKKHKYMGEEMEKLWEKGKFSLYLEEKILFLKRGVGQKYPILGKYTTL